MVDNVAMINSFVQLTCFSITLFFIRVIDDCWLPDAPSLMSLLSVFTVGMAFAVVSVSRKLRISSLKISQLPKFSWSTDFSSLSSQYKSTRPVIAFSLKIGASFSMAFFNSLTWPNRAMKSSQPSFDSFICVKSCNMCRWLNVISIWLLNELTTSIGICCFSCCWWFWLM